MRQMMLSNTCMDGVVIGGGLIWLVSCVQIFSPDDLYERETRQYITGGG